MVEKTKRTMPTRQQLRIWREYVETSEVLRSRLAGHLQSESGLSAGDYQVLLALSEATDKYMRSSELAVHIGWERSRLSHHLGRMEKRGLITKKECGSDLRGANIILTEAGYKAFRKGSVPHLRAVRELFIDALTSEQLAQIDTLTRTFRAHLGLNNSPPEKQ